jgi:hypothetical protein
MPRTGKTFQLHLWHKTGVSITQSRAFINIFVKYNQQSKRYIAMCSIIASKLCFRICHRRVQANQDSLKLNGTYQILDCTDDVDILGESVHTIKKNAEALVVASKKTTSSES